MKEGDYKWGILVGTILALEALDGENLSSAFDRYLEHPLGKIAAIGAVAITGAHLLNVFEKAGVERFDPIDRLGRGLGYVREKL